MEEKHRKITARILGVLAVIFFTLSVFMLTLYNRALDEDLYKDALVESNIYVIVADVVERKTSESIIAWEKDLVNTVLSEKGISEDSMTNTALIFVLDNVIVGQTPGLVAGVFDKIGLEKIFQNVTEELIDRDLQWIKGEREAHEIFTYIPTPEQIEKAQESNFTQVLDTAVKNAFGVENYERPIAESAVNLAGEQVETMAQESGVSAILDDVYGVSAALANAKQTVLDVRDDIQSIPYWGFGFMLVSFIFGGIAVYLERVETRIVRGAKLFLYSGISIIVISLIYYLVVVKLAINMIPFEQIAPGTKILTPEEAGLLTDSFKSILEHILMGLMSLAFWTGFVISVVSGIAFRVFVSKSGNKSVDIEKENTGEKG